MTPYHRYRLSVGCGWLLRRIIRYRNRVVQQNLDRAFPIKSRAWKRDVIKKLYIHFAAVLLDFVPMYQLDREDFNKLVGIENRAALEAAVEEEKGAIILLFHMGNWEVAAEWFAIQGYPVYALARRIHNPLVEKVVRQCRESHGMRLLSVNTPAMDYIRHLKANRMLLLVADQDAKHRGIFVDFFGIPSSTYRGAAALALRTGSPLLAVTCLRERNACYKMRIKRISLQSESSEKQDSIHQITQRYTQYFEEIIRAYPEQYMWFHRRWKTKPPHA